MACLRVKIVLKVNTSHRQEEQAVSVVQQDNTMARPEDQVVLIVQEVSTCPTADIATVSPAQQENTLISMAGHRVKIVEQENITTKMARTLLVTVITALLDDTPPPLVKVRELHVGLYGAAIYGQITLTEPHTIGAVT